MKKLIERESGRSALPLRLSAIILERKIALVLAAALGLTGSVSSLLQPVVLSELIRVVQAGVSPSLYVLVLALLLLIGGLLSGGQQYVVRRTCERVIFQIRVLCAYALVGGDMQTITRASAGELISRVGADTLLLRVALVDVISSLAYGVPLFVGALIGMVVINPVLFATTAGVVALFTAAVLWISRGVASSSAEMQFHLGRYSAGLSRVLGAIRTVRASNATDSEGDELSHSAEQAYRSGVRSSRAVALVAPVSMLSIQVSLLVVVGLGGYQVAVGALDVAGLVAFMVFLLFMAVPLNQGFLAIAAAGQARGAWQRLQEIADTPPEFAGCCTAARPVRTKPADSATVIEFRSVSFNYAPDSSASGLGGSALDNVSFQVDRGECVALVGPSGAGKSTVLSLALQFMRPQNGSIIFGGDDAVSLSPSAIRSRIGYVEQDSGVLEGSLRANLTLGSAGHDDAKLVEMLEHLRLRHLIDRDERGLDLSVGERGGLLSGGERQRIAIARALLRDPELLILDEPTSSLDGRSEAVAWDLIRGLSISAATLVVAHRLATAATADRVIVMDEGRVVAVGAHEELVASSPLYRELVAGQMSWA